MGCSLRSTPNGFEVGVLGQQPNDRTFPPITFDRDLVFQTRDHDLAIAYFRGAMHGHQFTIQDAGIFHTHALYFQYVLRLRLK